MTPLVLRLRRPVRRRLVCWLRKTRDPGERQRLHILLGVVRRHRPHDPRPGPPVRPVDDLPAGRAISERRRGRPARPAPPALAREGHAGGHRRPRGAAGPQPAGRRLGPEHVDLRVAPARGGHAHRRGPEPRPSAPVPPAPRLPLRPAAPDPPLPRPQSPAHAGGNASWRPCRPPRSPATPPRSTCI